MTRMNRRALLSSLVATGALATLPARGQQMDQLLVVVFAYGGWDVTYLFDPKPGQAEVDQVAGDWAQYGGLDLWRTGNMPAVDAFFSTYGTSCAVVNGVAVNSLVHETCLQNVLAGSGTGLRAGFGVRAAALAGADKPLPYLTIGGSAQVTGFESAAGQLGYSSQLAYAAVPSLSPAERQAVDGYLEQARATLAAQRVLDVRGTKRLDDYATAIARAASIANAAEGDSWLSDASLIGDVQPWGKVAAALAEGFSHAVFVQDEGFWDTHFGNAQQRGLYGGLFADLTELMEALEGLGLRERTTVLVVSEMGRTPVMNSNQGKDHWPFTSALLISERVNNVVVGQTDDQLAQVALPSGRRIQSQDVLATVATLMGVDGVSLYPDAEVLDALLA